MLPTKPPGTTQALGRAALAYASRGLPVVACHWPTPAELPQFCSCADLDCPSPACHPIEHLAPADATQDLSQLARWWLAHPTANPATVTDTPHVGVIELRHFARPEYVMRLLNAYQVDRGPVILAGHGRLQLLVANLSPTTDAQPAGGATLSSLAPGSLALLPPSRLMSGQRVQWMRRLHHVAQLPDATPLLAQLTEFVKTGVLDDPHPLLDT